MTKLSTPVLAVLIFITIIECKSIPKGYYHSDSIVTKWPTESTQVETVNKTVILSHNEKPGLVTKTLLKFGQVASKIGNAMGAHANKITRALDKICEVFKTVIPLLAAVCHVGQFGFCSATDEAPIRLSEAMNPNDLNLDGLDR
ncbi:uncharacterized protein LOC115891323 [Sitophilus oryzae]|uniref:Uncharacterized protein LOC115891323 n=1 Tax=Sitophilus oryzae TaxID=7048 RepID=A0A6J2YU42_SITOR|nr:uncharacterized protein LOC115891323 [Sitophilus oryzae]